MPLYEIKLTCTNVPFVAIEAGGLKKSLMDGNKTCWIDHSRCAHAVSASESSSCSISSSIMTSSSGTTTKHYKIGVLHNREGGGESCNAPTRGSARNFLMFYWTNDIVKLKFQLQKESQLLI
jgi:hypothetical protein